MVFNTLDQNQGGWLGHWTCNREVVGSTPGLVAIKWLVPGWVTVCGQVTISLYSQHQGQLRLPSLRCRQIAGLYGWGAFTSVRWPVTLCDPMWQVTLRSSKMGFPQKAIPRPNNQIFIFRTEKTEISGYLSGHQSHKNVLFVISGAYNFGTFRAEAKITIR